MKLTRGGVVRSFTPQMAERVRDYGWKDITAEAAGALGQNPEPPAGAPEGGEAGAAGTGGAVEKTKSADYRKTETEELKAHVATLTEEQREAFFAGDDRAWIVEIKAAQ